MSAELGRAVVEGMPPDDGVRVGIVASVFPLVITLQGAPITLVGQLGASVSVGDKVALLRQDQSWLVMGAILNSQARADRNIESFTSDAIAHTINTGTLADIVGFTMPFTRYRLNSRMRFSLTVAGRQGGGANQAALYAVLVTNVESAVTWTPTIIPGVNYNAASIQESATVERTLTPNPDLGTGLLTCQVQGRTELGGAGIVIIGPANDTCSLTVEEI